MLKRRCCCCDWQPDSSLESVCWTTDAANIQIRLTSSLYQVEWGDGTQEWGKSVLSHNYDDSVPHTFCIYPFRLDEVYNLDLDDCGLIDSIPPEIGTLPELQRLEAARNNLTGSIPPEIGDTGLLVLYLNNNSLSGSIPPEIGNLNRLRVLTLHSNNLTGSIPQGIGNSNLLILGLHRNNLSGSIPTDIDNCTNLQICSLYSNNLSGSIPAALAGLSAIQLIDIRNNAFSQPELSAFVDDMWLNRAQLGANRCDIRLQGNNGLTAQAIDQIEGTGSYTGDGLLQAGCSVTY